MKCLYLIGGLKFIVEYQGITENNYDILLDNCKQTKSFAFHYGLSTNENNSL